MTSVKELIEMVKDDYENVREVGKVSLIEKNSKHKDYVTENKIPLLTNFSLGTKSNDYGITKSTPRFTISTMIYNLTNKYQEELTYREAKMLKNVELMSMIDHKNGYIELTLYSTKLNYSVSILVEGAGNMKRGTITG